MNTFTLAGFIGHCHAVERDLKDIGPAIVAKACEMICAEAKQVLGEGYENWAPLSASTLAKKIGPGPLLETGEMRNSIEWTSEGLHGEVGSNNDKAVWHELGTSRIPPRPFLSGAAHAMGPKIQHMAGKAVVAAIMGRGLHSAEMRELLHALHILKEAAHAVKKAVEDFKDDGDRHGRRR